MPSPLFGNPKALAIAIGVFLLATLIVFADLLFHGGDRILSLAGQDTFTVFVGWFEFTFGEMARGNLPLWNPHLFSGSPCLGGFQEALLYPPSWLHLIMPLPQAINYGIALHVFLAGLFTYLWMARRGVHPAAAILSGLIFMFSGSYFMHITPGHLPNLQTMIWAPLIFLAVDDITTTRSLRGAWFGAGAIMMMILAGHPQYVYYTALIAAPYALAALWNAPSRLRSLGGLTLMCVGGIALSAIQLFTGLQAANESLRNTLDIQVAGTFPFPPENLLTLALPNFFGKFSAGMYWGRWLLWEDSLFIGAVALVLVLYGAIAGDQRFGRFKILGFTLLTLFIAFGTATPLYRLLYHDLPGFGSFRGASKLIFLTTLFLANLAGVGFDRLLRASTLSKRPAILLSLGALLMVNLASFLWMSGDAGRNGAWGHFLTHIDWSAEAYQHGGMAKSSPSGPFFWMSAHRAAIELLWCAGVCAGTAGLWFAARRDRRFVYAIGLLSAVELLTFACQNRPTFPLSALASQEQVMHQRLAQLQETEIGYRKRMGDHDIHPPELRVITNEPSVVLGVGGDEAWGNDPMVLRRYAEFMALQQDPPPGELPNPSPAWGMMRVRLVQSPVDQQWHYLAVPLLKRAELIENIQVIDNPRAMLAALSDKNFDFHRTVLIEKPVSPTPTAATTDPPGVAEVKELPDETDKVEVTADIRRPCILVISDNYSTGWHTLPLSDAPARHYDVIPVDYTLRGIPLTAGIHHFILEYRPKAYVVGKWVTLVSLAGWIAAGVMLSGWIRKKSSKPI